MDFIIDPDTNIQYSIFSNKGLQLLNDYLKSYKEEGSSKNKNINKNNNLQYSNDENHETLLKYLEKFSQN